MKEASIKYWTKAYEEWKGSGETQVLYCDKKGYKLHDFKNKTRQARECKIKEIEGSKFTPIQVENIEKSEPYCEIKFSGEHTVSFRDQESLIGLKNLIVNVVKKS
tara:strand:- start:552 stop:866 length:315 start_codon:yes stop_codon:yes gene_type:complete